jgi:single-stranded-DNA-specific exonuclease
MLHEGKEHGIELDKIPEDCDVVIIPDAGSMQKAEQQELLNRGKSILILDHHEVSGEIIDAEQLILVNNQVSDGFSNKSLSGAGVTFKFIQAYDESLPDLFVRASDYYDLAALGIIADAMDMRTLDNNYIAYHGLKSIKNKMFQALIKKQDFKLEGQITKYGVAFYIAPIINGVIRAGKMEEMRARIHGDRRTRPA